MATAETLPLGEPTTEPVRFRPRARLLETIGANLIKDEMAGVVELVKNAHDADANEVSVIFHHTSGEPKDGMIVVQDDGHGMDRDALVTGWMSPATDWKALAERSRDRKRPMLGRKGVGRFSAMRLGRELRIETSPRGQGVIYAIELKWEDITGGHKYLEDVELNLESRPTDQVDAGWTRLEIRDLKDRWDPARFGRLRRELRVLLSPMQERDEDPFEIRIDLSQSGLPRSDIDRLGGTITPLDLPEAADYVVVVSVDATTGRCEYVYHRHLFADRDPQELTVSDTIADIRLLMPRDERNEELDLPLPCGPLDFELRIWDRDAEILQHKLNMGGQSQYEGLTVRGLRNVLKDAAGISLYRDGFRVRPYGDPGFDWLGLGTRRVDNPTARLGMDQVYGLIDISVLANPGLEDKSSREGLEENLAFHALRQSVLAILNRIEPLRYQFRKRNGIGRTASKSTDALATERREAFSVLRSQMEAQISEERSRRELATLVDRAEQTSEVEHERLAEQAARMHDMHLLGILARFVLHEGRNMHSAFHAALKNMERAVERAIPDPVELRISGAHRPGFETGLRAARDVQKRFYDLLNELDPLTRARRGRRANVKLLGVLERVVSILRPSMLEGHILLEIEGVEDVVVRAWEQDVMYILYNLMDNAVYWVQLIPDDRRIRVWAELLPAAPDDGKQARVAINIQDNGPGVPERSADSIFDLNYTEKPEGLGIGLFIARESAGRSHGRIELVNPGEPGAHFRLTLESTSNHA